MGKLGEIVDRLESTDGVSLIQRGELEGISTRHRNVGHIVVIGSRYPRHLGAVSAIACDLGIAFSAVNNVPEAHAATDISSNFDATGQYRLVLITPDIDPHDTINALHSLNHLPNIHAKAAFEIE